MRDEAPPSAAVELISEEPERKRRRVDHEIYGSTEKISGTLLFPFGETNAVR